MKQQCITVDMKRNEKLIDFVLFFVSNDFVCMISYVNSHKICNFFFFFAEMMMVGIDKMAMIKMDKKVVTPTVNIS